MTKVFLDCLVIMLFAKLWRFCAIYLLCLYAFCGYNEAYSEAKVWFTRASDIPGLCLDSESFDTLIDDVRAAAPEMLLLNCNYEGPVYLIFEAVRIEEAETAMVS